MVPRSFVVPWPPWHGIERQSFYFTAGNGHMSLKDVASNMNSYLKIAPRGFFNWGGTHLRSDLNVESVYMAVEILSHQFP